MRYNSHKPILQTAPVAILALAAAVPLIVAGEAIVTRPITHSQTRVEQLADCVQRAARQFCHLPVTLAGESFSHIPLPQSQKHLLGIEIPHAKRILLQNLVINLPPPIL